MRAADPAKAKPTSAENWSPFEMLNCWCYITLHCTASQCILISNIALYGIVLYRIALETILLLRDLHCIALQWIAQRELHWITMYCIVLEKGCIVLGKHCIAQRELLCTELYCIALNCITVYWKRVALHCIVLHCIGNGCIAQRVLPPNGSQLIPSFVV